MNVTLKLENIKPKHNNEVFKNAKNPISKLKIHRV